MLKPAHWVVHSAVLTISFLGTKNEKTGYLRIIRVGWSNIRSCSKLGGSSQRGNGSRWWLSDTRIVLLRSSWRKAHFSKFERGSNAALLRDCGILELECTRCVWHKCTDIYSTSQRFVFVGLHEPNNPSDRRDFGCVYTSVLQPTSTETRATHSSESKLGPCS